MRPVFLLFLISLSSCCLTAQTLDANAIKAASSYGFTENKGQVIDQNNQPNPSVKFLCALPDLQVQIRDKGYSYEVKKEIRRIAAPESGGPKGKKGPDIVTYGIHRIDITFDGANQGIVWEASEPQEGYSNYYTAGTSEEGVLEVLTYRRLIARNVWDNIDVEFLTSNGEKQPVKYNVVLRPGADLAKVRLRIVGAYATSISPSGGLMCKTAYGDLEETIPLSFIEDSSDVNRENIEVRFQVLGENVFGFQLPAGFSAKGKTLVIDPTPDRVWSTYYGGSEKDYGASTSVDGSGNIFVTGETFSASNIATSGAHQATYAGNNDGYLVKFNSNGVRLWGTYYGGDLTDSAVNCTNDGTGNVYVAGESNSTSGIATPGAHQATKSSSSNTDAFLIKFNSSGVRQWGTYYGGSGDDNGYACTVDNSGNVYMTGATNSTDNITTNGAHQTSLAGQTDAFLVKFNTSGVRQWATYYGGSGSDFGGDCASDANGNIFMSGQTTSTSGIASVGAHQTVNNLGDRDGYFVKFNSSGVRQWASYYGGSDWESNTFCATDGGGNLYIVGWTASSNAITTSGSHQPTFGGGHDAYLAKFNTSGVRQWGTYNGSSGTELCWGVVVDINNNIYLCGSSTSTNNIATPNSYQTTLGGQKDAFLTKFNTNGVRQWGTYFGKTLEESGESCAIDASGNVILAGNTSSTSGIASAGGHQTTYGGGSYDAFLVKFTQVSCTVSATISSTTPTCSGQSNGSATVTASGSNAYTYLWNNSQTSATATNLTAGVYTVTVTGSNGCTTSATATIANSPAVQAGFTYTINGGLVTFSNTSTNSTTYLWNFGNSQTSTQSNPTYTYNTPGNYNVCLTATGLCGSVQSCQTITISPPNDYCWHWQNPLPQGNELNDVFFINELTGWAAGDFGTILKTTNGGATWQAQTSGTTNHLRSIYFTDNQTGWAVGGDGNSTILKTINGGATWQAQISGTTEWLFSVLFIGNQTGWAVGTFGKILKTINGGTTWQSQTSGSANHLRSIYFTDNQNGWAAGSNGTILRTTNGGTTWQTQTSGTTNTIESVYFTDNQNGWAVGYSGIILKTTNGGTTWQTQTSGTTAWLNSVHFRDNQTGWAVGDVGTILKTTNGGATWQTQTPGTTIWLNSVHFTDNQTGWAVGTSGIILKTTNGGTTWQTQISGTTELLFSVHFTDNQTGWAVGTSGTIIKTTNGGTTWQTQTSGTTAYIQAVYFTDNQTGWALGANGTILKTTNGGTTWQAQTSGTTEWLFSVHFRNNQTGWAIGSHSVILKTTNGGVTWQIQASGTTQQLSSVHFSDNQTGWVVGYNGTILKTTNGGATWQAQTSGTTMWLNSVYFTDNQTGWAVGDNGVILKTTNGGATWQTQTSGTTHVLSSVYFMDNQNGWAVGTSGTIIKTTNSGATWQAQTSGTTVWLFSVHFTDNQTGWAVGKFGAILKYGSTQKPVVQNITLCKNIAAVPLSATGTNLLWYTAPSGGTGSSVAPIPNTAAVGTTNYYVSQSPIGVGNCTESDRATLSVTIIDSPTDLVSTTPSCAGQNNGSATVTTSGGSTPYTYLWSNGQTNATATNLAMGIYTVTVTGSNGCATSATVTIINSPAVQAGFTYTINGGLVTFSNTSTNASSYLWEFGNGQTSTQANPTITFNTQGTYSVCLTVTGACGTSSSCQSVNMVFDYCMHWQNPFPQGNGLWDVHFINDQLGWAVGDAGTILKSTDGGESWTPQTSPTVESLREVQFVNDQIGWAVGGNGVILKTTNGGTLWQFQHSNVSLGTLTALHFLDQNTGWAVGENGTILKTSNGGTTWVLTQIPPGSNGHPFFWDVFFVNNQTGWAVGFAGAFGNTGPKIMKTTDGGTTWNTQSVSVSDGLWAVYFVNDQIGYGVGRFNSVVKTTNGGATWIPQAVNLWFVDVRFKDALNGWAVGIGGTIVKTTDGGVNWVQQTSGVSSNLLGTFSRDGQTCWTVGANGTILKSIDSATTWSQKSVGSQAALYDIHFADSQKGWSVGSSGTILKTTNGGYIWSTQNSGTLNILNSVFFADSQTGWTAGYNGTILKTADGGTNWSLQPSGTTKVLRSIFFTDNQIGWAVGDSGIVVKTLNGGASWTVQNIGFDKYFSVIYFINNQTGWIAGFNGTILKTVDGGNNWTPQTTGTSAYLKDINFVDEQTGWAVGGSGTILKTTNGGSTWLVQTSSITTYLNAIKAFNAQTARIVGANGIVLKTSNGGSTWERQLGVTSNDLYSLYMENAQTGWFAGVGGAIIKLGAPTVPQTQNIIRCKNSPAEPLSAAGINLHWYTTPTGGIGSAIAPIPSTSTIGTTTYYVSQSPIGVGNCTESERAAIVVTVTAPDISISTTGGCSSNGTATATASGGTAPYSYQWSNNQSTQTISNLPTGTYTVTVTDASGCTHTAIATVSGGVAPTASISSTVSPCIGQSNGSATVTASGGIPPYTYIWSNGQTGATANNLVAGNHFVTVTGNNGCSSTTTVNISSEATPTASISSTVSPCVGQSNGSATIVASGGIPPYAYMWNNGQIGATANNLTAGNYFVTVTGYNGCSSTTTVNISSAASPTASISSTVSPCVGQSNGSATIVASGGIPPYTYTWSNGQSGATGINLAAGTYFIAVEDNNGCSSVVTATLTNVPVFNIELLTNPEPNGQSCQSSAAPQSGTPPYSYLWSNGQTTQTASDLPIGQFSVSVTDASGCASLQTGSCIPVSTNEISDIEFFSIKPNPANSYLSIQIRLKQAEDLQMRFFNSIGQQLYENAFNSQVIDEVIDLSDFPSGCYFLQFTTPNGSKSEIITIAR